MGAWNIQSRKEDDHLSLSSFELKCLNNGITGLSEVRRPESGEIMVVDYTCYWSGRSDGYRDQGVAVTVTKKLTPMIIELAPVNKHIMRRRIHQGWRSSL